MVAWPDRLGRVPKEVVGSEGKAPRRLEPPGPRPPHRCVRRRLRGDGTMPRARLALVLGLDAVKALFSHKAAALHPEVSKASNRLLTAEDACAASKEDHVYRPIPPFHQG